VLLWWGLGCFDTGLTAGETLVARYTYDGLGRRVKVETPEGETTTCRHFFYTTSWQVLETRTTTTSGTGPETLPPEMQFVWSLRYLDAPVLRDENTDGTTDDLCDDERLYYTTDANQNVTALLDASGTVVERYTYDAYGKPTFLKADWSLQQVQGQTDGTASAYDNAIPSATWTA